MNKLFYYQPIINPIAKNKSEKFGVNIITKLWKDDSKLKMELKIFGKTKNEALEKFNKFLKSDNCESVELECNYYLCSEEVIKYAKPFEVSKPFKSGFQNEEELNYYVAWLNFEEVEKHFNEVIEPHNEKYFNGDFYDDLKKVGNFFDNPELIK